MATGDQEFGHAGDLGDIVYGLPAIRAAGGGTLYLFPTPGRTREPMTEARAALIRRLLMRQPYIRGVVYSETPREHPLNKFRDHYRAGNLADMHLAALGFGWRERTRRWIDVDRPRRMFPVIVHRSPRYHNESFPWRALAAHYAGRVGFLGHPEEHAAFCGAYGFVPYVPTKDLLELAEVIAGSDLFVGNQSCPAAVAEGMKHPMILEVCPNPNNCIFERPGRINLWDERVEWPAVGPNDAAAEPPPAVSIGLALVTINVGGVLHPNSRDSFVAAARRWGCTYVEVTEPPAGLPHPAFAKLWLFDVACAERVFYVDADTVIRADTPSPFETFPDPAYLYAVADLGPADVWSRECERVRDVLDFVMDPRRVFNSGVFLLSRSRHDWLLRQAREWVGAGWYWWEQAPLNAAVQRAGAPVRWLPGTWNDLRPGDPSRMASYVYHYAGQANREHVPLVNWRACGVQ